MSFMVHRDIVTAQSGWFRDNLPPANEVSKFANGIDPNLNKYTRKTVLISCF